MYSLSKKLSVLISCTILATVFAAGCGQEKKTANTAPQLKPATQAKASTSLKDGVYVGSGQGYADQIKVKVTVKDKKISTIEVLSINDSPKAYKKVLDETLARIIKNGNPVKIDSVSGATFSSNGIRYAVADALKDQLPTADMNTIKAQYNSNEPIRIKTKAANDERHKKKQAEKQPAQ